MNSLKLCFIFTLTMLSCALIRAQGNDTSVFFRYAATFEQLLPLNYYPAHGYMPDTASLALLNYGAFDVTMKKHVEQTTYANDRVITTELGEYFYRWDKEGRINRYKEYFPGDSVAKLDVRYSFLVQQKLSSVIVVAGNNVDTATFQYNRSGVIGTWRRHVVGADSGYVINGTRMYDSRNRVIVATNMKYGPLPGSYIYEYNSESQLVRRAFLAGGTGVILCTDTLEYAYQSESRSVLMVTHKLKVAGMEKWVTVESKNIYPYSNVILSYTDNNDADSNYLYRNYPEYTVRYEYDEKARVTAEYFGTLVQPDQITANYYYGAWMLPDSIVYTERIVEKKVSYTRVYSRDVREYNDGGRIARRSISTYLFEEMKKKDKKPPVEVINISYIWQ